MARARKKAITDGSSASFKPTKKQRPKPKPIDPAPRYELRQRKTRYGDIEQTHPSSGDEKLEPKDAAPKHRRGRPKRANDNIQQFNPPSRHEGEENASVPQPNIVRSKDKDAAPKRKRGPPKPQAGHVERPHTLPDDQNTNNAPQDEPNTKAKGLGRKGKQAQPRKPNNRIEKLRNPSDKENANLGPRNKPNPKTKGAGRKRKQDQQNHTPQDLPKPKTKVFIKIPKQVDAQIDVLHPKHFKPSHGLSKYLKDKIISEEYSDGSSFDSDESQFQESFDIKDNREVFGLPTPDDVKRWKEGAYFIKSDSGLKNSRWVGGRPLGQGGFGISGLWQQCNADGRVKKQMVIKQIGGTRHMWEPEKPEEVRIMEKMKTTKIRGLVRLINYKRYHRKRIHRIYMEFCPYGDLSRLIERYRRFGRHFPEPFLWQTFFYLAEAASAMRFGPSERNDEWDYNKEIVHRDIKPPNIFLGGENKHTGLPFYPTAKMGDFGLAIETNISDPQNPHDYAGCGTANYMAPEQQPLHERERKAERQGKRLIRHILSPTNVFAIGATMFELVTLERADHWFDETGGLGALSSQVMLNANNSAYSDQLIELIVGCMNAEPADRIEVEELHAQIKRHRDLIAKDYGSREPRNNDRLYYKGNEINDMPAGDFIPLVGKIERPNLAEPLDFIDPSLSPVRFPDLGPAAYDNKEDGPEQVFRKGDDADEPFEIYNEEGEESRPSHIRSSEAEFAKWLGRPRTKRAEVNQVEKGASKRPAKPQALGQHVSKVCRRPLSFGMTDDSREGDIGDAENGVGEEEGANQNVRPYAGTGGDDIASDDLEVEDAGEDADGEGSLLGWAGAAMKRLFSNQNPPNGKNPSDQHESNAQQHQQNKQKGNRHDSRINPTPSWSQITNHSKQRGNQHDSRINPTPSWSPLTTPSHSLPSSQPPHTGNYRLKRSHHLPQNISLETSSPSSDIQASQRLSGTEKEEEEEDLHDDGNDRRKRSRMEGNEEVVAETHSAPSTVSLKWL
ncbi:hypothetical protein JMJ35_008533 [Cladonia borealis]|uniref:non-specific serine/threonine protein kinase n=1 Tax=Cladonia borealis TaxID=184061 RepID=A0AA39QTX7_9LECA|nr:hypothetical protein JMJ35_008533 [Cladonia borealis]